MTFSLLSEDGKLVASSPVALIQTSVEIRLESPPALPMVAS
jgi:hypothetical protein